MNPKKITLLILVIIGLLFLFSSFRPVPALFSVNVGSNIAYVPDEVIVKFKSESQKEFIAQTIDDLSGRFISYLGNLIDPQSRIPQEPSHRSFIGDDGLFLVKLPQAISAEQAISILRSNPAIEYAELNLLLRPLSADESDPLYNLQWALHNTGQSGGTVGADIDAQNAWALCTGDAGTVVAVLDCGIDTYHPELVQNLWHNPGEIQNNGQDDDHNGFTDDYEGWHWGPNVPEQERKNPNPYGSSHATEIAGVIGAAWDNNTGIKGICQDVSIMNLNLDGDNSGWDAGCIHVSDMINAIDYAVQNGASIISCSQGWHRKLPHSTEDPDESLWNEFLNNKASFEAAIIRARIKGFFS